MNGILNRAGLKMLPFLVSILVKTLRIRILNEPDRNNYVFIFWHSKMIAGWWVVRKRKSVALVSKSKDGMILSRLLMNWGYKIVRGSSSKGGKEAVSELSAYVKEGYSAVITPDGPRGPAMTIKNGPLIISHDCKVPVIPISIRYSSKKILSKSWDRFEIPMPFSLCEIIFGSKHSYEQYLEEKELEEFKLALSKEMQ